MGRQERFALGFAAPALVWALVACSASGTPSITVEDAWARPALATGAAGAPETGTGMATGGGSTGAVFMLVTNRGGEADRLVGATTDAAAVVEVHETVLQGDVLKMQMLEDGLEVPARGEVWLKPGGYHLMLIGLSRDLRVGDRFRLELQFEKGGTLTVEPEVRQP